MPLVGANLVGGGGSSSGGSSGTSWDLEGNSDTNPTENFLGTVDVEPLVIRTNNVERVRVDQDGRIGIGESNPQAHIHIKSHSGYPGSGLRIETFAFSTLSIIFDTIYSFQIPLHTTCLIRITLTAREGASERASFVRTISVYREGGIAQVLNKWQSDFTMKSNNNFGVNYNITMDSINFQVKNANPVETLWTGHIEIELIG